MSFTEAYLRAAHGHCTTNEDEIRASNQAACFYCKGVFPASEVDEFLEEERTALCPRCPVDSVLGDASGFPVTDPAFLAAMHEYWFERSVTMSVFGFRSWFITIGRRLASWFAPSDRRVT